MRIHKVNQNYLFGAGGVMLAGILGAMLFPAMPEGAHAEDVSQSAGTKVNLTVQPVIAVSAADNAVSVDVTPTQGGTFEKNATTLSVSTNNETGYSLYLSTANGKSTLASLNPSVTNTIGAVSGTVEEGDFGDNTWGYNLSEGTPSDIENLAYQAVPGDSTVQKGFGSEGPTASDTYTLTFGTKVNTSLPSGTYSNQVVVSVVANPAYVPNLTQISNMQDMTTEICNASTVGQTNRLTDTRDGKLYWVAKLADNQCWMTQNLDLDLSTNTALTPDDSDVSTSWTPTMSTQTTLSSGDFTSGTDGYNGVRSFDGGMYVNSSLTSWDTCSYWNSTFCSNWTKVEDESDGTKMVAMSEPRDDGVILDGDTYDAHYLVGNYYQWNAATAGTGASVTDQYDDASSSICPKGWRLPSRGSSSTTGNEFYELTNTAYGITNSTDGANSLRKSPLYFVPAGYVYSGSLRYAGLSGFYWSSTAVSSNYAYFLYFRSGGVYPSNSVYRYYGRSVRCLAR